MPERIAVKAILVMASLTWAFAAEASVDSYRFLHVTISTPWYLFIFLLGGVFSPFILMAVLAWYSVVRKAKHEEDDADSKSSVE